SPDSPGTACPLSGRNSTSRPVQILEASSDPSSVAGTLSLSPSSFVLLIACASAALLEMSLVGTFVDRRSEALLREQTRRLDTALNNMSQGLLLFDSSGRLLMCNDRYRQMYGLS